MFCENNFFISPDPPLVRRWADADANVLNRFLGNMHLPTHSFYQGKRMFTF
mgnify:CR=1 FL=1